MMKRFFPFASLFLLVLGLLIAPSSAQADECDTQKEGLVVLAPSALNFYVSTEQTADPDPVTVELHGFAYPVDDGCATIVSWGENVYLCWIVGKGSDWITLNGSDDAFRGSGTETSFEVGIDLSKLPVHEVVYQGGVQIFEANVTVATNLIPQAEWHLPVRVFVNALRSVEERSVSTSGTLNLRLNIPVAENVEGALYILLEHPQLLPGQTYAYRLDDSGAPSFELFSQNGHPVSGARNLYYSYDIQDTPVVLPSADADSSGLEAAPYSPMDVSDLSGNYTAPSIKGYIPVRIGEGLSLHGLEGDLVIHALVGNRHDIEDWTSWKEILLETVHIVPVTGTWLVTEEFGGSEYSYPDTLLILNEERGALSGLWSGPSGTVPVEIAYLEPPEEGYEIRFTEVNALGETYEYLYRLTSVDPAGAVLSGTWTYREEGAADWAMPQAITLTKAEVEIPLTADPETGGLSYQVDGAVNGYPVRFTVDTGAEIVSLPLSVAEAVGIDYSNPEVCTPGSVSGVIATGEAYFCPVDIEIQGGLRAEGVMAAFSDGSSMNLLGMTFLQHFHIATDPMTGKMVIAP